MPGIFISYRREDSFAYAGRLYDHLASHFGKDNVFMDVDNIEPGLDFVEVLEQTVSSCDALVVVIGKQWLSAADEQGHRRLEDPQDLVRLEIATALGRKVRVVPTLVAGARMPRAQDLPEAIASLARRNALEISDLAFHQNVSRLIEALEKAVKQIQPTAEPLLTPAGESPKAAAAARSEPRSQPPPDTLGAAPETGPPPVAIPRWRTVLLYSSYFFRLCTCIFGLFTLFVGIELLFVGRFNDNDWILLVGVVIATVLSLWAALWFDKKAAR